MPTTNSFAKALYFIALREQQFGEQTINPALKSAYEKVCKERRERQKRGIAESPEQEKEFSVLEERWNNTLQYWKEHYPTFIQEKNQQNLDDAVEAARVNPNVGWISRIIAAAQRGMFEYPMTEREAKHIKDYEKLGFKISNGGKILNWWLG